VRTKYLAHIEKMLTLSGEAAADAKRDAALVIALEKSLATASLTLVAMRDPSATDHPMSAQQLASLAPHVSWPRYFHNVGVMHPVAKVIVAQPEFFKRADSLLATAPLPQWRAYLRYHELSLASSWLSTPFVNEGFAFSSTFTGAKELLPRWKRCIRATDGQMGEALGEAYVAQTFPPTARARARQVSTDLETLDGLLATAAVADLDGEAEERRSNLDSLERCLQALSPRAQTLARRRFAEQVPINRLAQQFKQTRAAIANSLTRIRAGLRSCVEAAGTGTDRLHAERP